MLSVANKYDIKSLKSVCEAELGSTLSPNNAIDRLLLADTHVARGLKTVVLKFIAQNLNDVKQTESWTQMKKDHPLLAFDILDEVHRMLPK